MGFFDWFKRKEFTPETENQVAIASPEIPTLYDIYTDGGALRNGKKDCKASWAFACPFPPENQMDMVSSQLTQTTGTTKMGGTTIEVSSDSGLGGQQHGKLIKAVPVTYRAGMLQPIIKSDWHTNNKGELMAIIQALYWAREQGMKRVRLISDSQYAIYCINHHVTNWRRKANTEYFDLIDELARSFDLVDFSWVKGHVENPTTLPEKMNEFVDDLCNDVLGVPRSYRHRSNQEGMTMNRSGFQNHKRKKYYPRRRR